MREENRLGIYTSVDDAIPKVNQLIAQQLCDTSPTTRSEEVLRTLHERFSIEVADKPEAVEEAHRLRYQVYCLERGYESSDTGLEIDEFDAQSSHVILRHRMTGMVVGTVRLVRFSPEVGKFALPIQQFCDAAMLDHFPLHSTGEISRFAISKELRGLAGSSVTPVQVGLMRGIVQVSRELGLTHWCAIMEQSFLRLLRATAIHFHQMGPPVAHHGIRQPVHGMIKQVLHRLRSEKPTIGNFISPDGLFLSNG